jgi:hypothetical protein
VTLMLSTVEQILEKVEWQERRRVEGVAIGKGKKGETGMQHAATLKVEGDRLQDSVHT